MTTTGPTPTTLTRRRILAGAGVVCATCVAGCATYGKPTGADPAAAPTPSGGAPAPAPAASAGIAAVADIPVGGGKIFADQSVVVTQPQAGTFAAFGTTCTHQGCQVNEVTDGSISCPCHGSKFAVADGAPTDGPAKSPLERRQVSVQGDRIVLA